MPQSSKIPEIYLPWPDNCFDVEQSAWMSTSALTAARNAMNSPVARFWLLLRARRILPSQLPTLLVRRPSPVTVRPFSRTQPQHKSKGKTVEKEPQAVDPFDLATLKAEIQEAVDRLKDKLARLRTGGRFDPQLVEDLRVTFNKKKNDTAKLSDLAQVIPKGGRSLTVIVGQDDVSSYVESSQCRQAPANIGL